ncbi:MAG: OmpA family protein [Acidobacteriota bacterium]|nr:OmpA family protein [Acidobacteriota bacterium]
MKRVLVPVLATLAVALTAGCATKNYVKQQEAPLVNKVDELDERTAQTTRGIHDLDHRAQSGIQGVEAKASSANQKALVAGQQADQAQTMASQANQSASELTERVINLDNYHPVEQASVLFAFNKADLTKKGREELDRIGQQFASVKGSIVQIEGRTDSVGSAAYNYDLSQRRAAAVTQYLAAHYNVPAHKIYVIGLGKDAPVEENHSARGRAENRRVDVRLMSNTGAAQAPAEGSTSPAPSKVTATTASLTR